MRVAIVCNDTRGGIVPYVALGVGLQRAGHEVRAVAPADFISLFTDAGLAASPLSGSTESALRAAGGAASGGMIASMRFVAKELPVHLAGWTRETLAACEGADMLTGGVGGMVVGMSVAEKMGKPFVETHLQPVGAPTDAYPGVLLAGLPAWMGKGARRLSHRASDMAVWMPFRRAMAKVRRDVLGMAGPLPPSSGLPVLYGFSRHVVPLHTGAGGHRHVTGYWTQASPPDWRPPAEIDAFLREGPPVVSIGFGSMASDDPHALTRLVVGAVRQAGLRAVLLAGWGGLSDIEADDIRCAPALPHDWLFPRVAVAVHHGGAGTTGAALRAGIPAVVVPFTMDQPFWAGRVAAFGAGPTPIPRRHLTQDRLASALSEAATSDTIRAIAAGLGEQIRAEDGVAAAVAHFDRLSAR